MNFASIIGILLGAASIFGGNLFEGGKISSIIQPTAAFIVVGGTLGATLLSFSLRDVIRALSTLRDVFLEEKKNPDILIDSLIRYAGIARKHGMVSLERELPKIEDRFLRKSISLAIDHISAKALREMMEQENFTYETEKRRAALVFETAGGFAPTIGILGAVLGLVHVMENLSDPSKLGSGIAVAFIATVYGVGSANLILLPIAKKLAHKINYELSIREMMLEGVIGIQTGLNPRYLRERLEVFVEGTAK